MVQQLANDDPQASSAAYVGLTKFIKAERNVEVLKCVTTSLTNLMVIGDRFAARQALKALREYDSFPTSAIPALTICIQRTNQQISLDAVETLGLLGASATPAVPTLIQALEVSPHTSTGGESELSLDRFAAAALGNIGSQTAIPALKAKLRTCAPTTRIVVAVALLKISRNNSEAHTALRETIKDSNTRNRRLAVWAIEDLRSHDDAFRDDLRLLIQSESDDEVRGAAKRILARSEK